MRTLVKSLKRLYEKEKITLDQVRTRVDKGSISEKEYELITGELFADNGKQ